MVNLSPKEFASANCDIVVPQQLVYCNRMGCTFACNRHTHGNSLENFLPFNVLI